MKHFNDNNNNNNNNNNNDDNDTYDGKMRVKISDIRILFSRLGNRVTNKDRNKITKELHEIDKKKNLSDK